MASLGILGSWFDLETYMYIGLMLIGCSALFDFSYSYVHTCLGFSECKYYPRFVAAASTTIFIRENEDEGEEFALGFRLGGREFNFTLATLATVWRLKDEGDTFKGGNYPLGTWDEFSKATAVRDLHLEHAAPGKYAVSRMSTDHCLLLYVLSYVLLPRKSNHGTATEEDLLILWVIGNEKQIHWPYLMANRLFRYSQGRSGSFLALAHLWTGLFEMAPLDLSREEVVNPGSANIITSKNINQMRRNLVNQTDAAEGVGEEAAGDMPMPDTQPQPTVGTSSQVPTETEVAGTIGEVYETNSIASRVKMLRSIHRSSRMTLDARFSQTLDLGKYTESYQVIYHYEVEYQSHED
ncbi:hypothetical protein PIB30_082467 [Stylosanthes scabra]|uniref:Uncharacterized protein n=1 Tax=Stylosanthes scabra TaxID=79078 RepID=A0ABU6SS80_9FABA|nr:hypothetical protein [Stylosanthes scabra]